MHNKLIVIIGPTATKKTTIAHKIAKSINGEIINGDAFQIYKELNVGINKPSPTALNEVKYHLLNIKNINESYSIKDYIDDFKLVYRDIVNQKKIPILCGGSHLYIDSIVKGYNLDPSLQDSFEQLNGWSDAQISDFLKVNDIDAYEKNINNFHRMKRMVAKIISKTQIKNKPIYDCFIIMINDERENIYERINKRVDQFLLNNKWKLEIEDLIAKYGDDIVSFNSFKAIGYKQIYDSIKSNLPINIESIKQKTRHLAKHQLTWCNNKFDNKIMFMYNDLANEQKIQNLITKIQAFYND